MPIYAYKCESCGFSKDVLRKMSDPPLTECPNCGKATFTKQLTAAGFQLKGSGWYATDFRNGNNASAAAKPPGEEGKSSADTSAKDAKPADSGGKSSSADAPAPAPAPAPPTSTPSGS